MTSWQDRSLKERRWWGRLVSAPIARKIPSPPWSAVFAFSRKALAAHIGVIILATLALIDRTANAIGNRSYLMLVYFHLFFYPSTPFAEHLENSILHLATAAVGLGVASAAIAGAVALDPPGSKVPYATPASTAVGACVLIILCLVGGFFESYTPRLKTAMRTMLFSITWTLTGGSATITSTIFTGQFYPAATAAAASVVACALAWPKTAHSTCTDLLVETLGLQRDVLIRSVSDFYGSDEDAGQIRRPSKELEQSRRVLVRKMAQLSKGYQSARIEICIGRVSIVAARPLMLFTRKARAWMSCGMGLGTHEAPDAKTESGMTSDGQDNDSAEDPPESFRMDVSKPHAAGTEQSEAASQIFRAQIQALLDEVSIAISTVQACVHLTMSSTYFGHPGTDDVRWSLLYTLPAGEATSSDVMRLLLPPRILLSRRRQLDSSIESFRGVLSAALRRFTTADGLSTPPDRVKKFAWSDKQDLDEVFKLDMYDTSFLMITLLEVAKETALALQTCQVLLAKWHRHPYPRLLWPSMSFLWWLRAKSKPFDDINDVFEKDMIDQEGFEIELALRERRADAKPSLQRKVTAQLSEWSSHPHFVSWRVQASKFIYASKRSTHLRYALKLAFGVAMLSLMAWLPGSRQWFTSQRGVWLIVTYVWVLETSTGATFRIALYRSFGTIAGAIYAMIAWYICGEGHRPAIGLFIVLAEIPASYLILCSKRSQNIGVVFGLTQAIIVLIPIKMASQTGVTPSVPLLGIERAYQILIGIGFAVIVNLAVWPLHARTFLVRSIAGITRQLSTIYLSLARQMLNLEAKLSPESAAEFEKLERKTQRDLSQCAVYLDIMQSEISLIPKPTETLRLFVDSLQRIRDLLVLLRRVRETAMSAIRAEACFNVLNLRTELVSSVLLNLWVVGESLLSKSRLPQFMPSCRGALDGLTEAMREQVHARREKKHAHGRTPSQGGAKAHMWEPSDVTKASSMLALGQEAHMLHTPQHHKHQNEGASGASTPGRRLHSEHHNATLRSVRVSAQVEKDGESIAKSEYTEDYSFFFVLAEHALLSEMIYEIEKLLVLSKLLLGEQQFMELAYLPHAEAATPQTRHSRKRALRRSEIDAKLDTMSGDSLQNRQDAHPSANNSWMQGFGLTLPLPATAKAEGAKDITRGASGLQNIFRSQGGPRHSGIDEGSESRCTESNDTDLANDAAVDGRDLSARLEKELEKGNAKSR